MRKGLSSGQQWFLRPYFPLINGMFIFRSGLRFSFRALKCPNREEEKVILKKGSFSFIIANHAGDEVIVLLRKVNRNFGFDGKGDEASLHFTSYITPLQFAK